MRREAPCGRPSSFAIRFIWPYYAKSYERPSSFCASLYFGDIMLNFWRARPEVVLDFQGDDACYRLIDACH